MAWQRSKCEEAGYIDDIYYTIRNSGGGSVTPVTRLTYDTAGWDEGFYYPNLAQLSNNRALFLWTRDSDGEIVYSVRDSSGNPVKSETAIGASGGVCSDAAQLSDGNIVVAWDTGWNVRFAALDGTTYNRTYGPYSLYNPAAVTGSAYVSVAADGDGHAVLTWMDYDVDYRRNLYYALVDGGGNTLTDPMVFHTSQATPPYVESSYEGYGNTSYSMVSPTTSDVDTWVMSSLAAAPPGGVAAVLGSAGNEGSTTATSVVLSATLDSELSYAGASPAPASAAGNTVTWNLSDLGFLGSGHVALYVNVPLAAINSRYPITWTIASAGPEADFSDNVSTGEVMIAGQVFLPLVLRND